MRSEKEEFAVAKLTVPFALSRGSLETVTSRSTPTSRCEGYEYDSVSDSFAMEARDYSL